MRLRSLATASSTGLAGAVALGVMLASAAPAAAAEGRDTSEPTGELTVTQRAGSTTDHDRDGNPDTATRGDKVSTVFQVLKNFVGEDDRQTVHITVGVDGPGTSHDSTATREVSLTDGDGTTGFPELFKVKKDTPIGEYAVTVSATATETARTTVAIVVQPRSK